MSPQPRAGLPRRSWPQLPVMELTDHQRARVRAVMAVAVLPTRPGWTHASSLPERMIFAGLLPDFSDERRERLLWELVDAQRRINQSRDADPAAVRLTEYTVGYVAHLVAEHDSIGKEAASAAGAG